MATSTGKKGKKASKKNKLSLGEFLTDGNATPMSQIQVAVPTKLRDWADECEEDDDERPTRTQLIALPTAPRATRLLNDDTIPHNPPYSAYISNLPYDLNENDLYDFFQDMEISSMRLPRDDGDSGRVRGFGYIEFVNRQDLIDALSLPEPLIHGRRIRIDLPSENDQKRNQRNNRNYDNYGGDSERSMGNWRDGPRPNADRDQGQRRPYNSYNRDGGDRGRDRDSDRERYPDSGSGGNWRMGDRPVQPPPSSPPSSRRGYDRGDRGDRGFRRGGDLSGDRGGRREAEPRMERPKLVLQPRTLPLPEKIKPEPEPEEAEKDTSRESKFDSGNETSEEKENREQQTGESRPKPTPVPAANVFGDAKPVDTAARLKEIEERLQEKQRQEREERQRKTAVAGSSGDEGEKEKTDPSKDEEEERHTEEKSEKKPEEIINWRVRSDDRSADRRGQSPPRRYSPSRKFNKRNDDYYPDNRDNRDMRDNRDRAMNRDNRNMRDNRRDYNRPSDLDRGYRAGDRDRGNFNRPGGRDMTRDEHFNQDRRDNVRPIEREQREREPKPIEERMPKFQEPSGPNLSMKNTFEGLSADEVDE
ncbi:eukaryotic translation initiation factor 4B-like [Toxorhynchites rutilus septentrionalis]|uniref:eukaryotic translation initiation factor 4B-like n=1 Tax=Toxorhynchites rutilus septentrionalis TaxID=329112 RepID=UPI002478B5B1|nr:eukaryotic translation initiation factor 4B-like [Toxorhynchites rutilus septentrionalis]